MWQKHFVNFSLTNGHENGRRCWFLVNFFAQKHAVYMYSYHQKMEKVLYLKSWFFFQNTMSTNFFNFFIQIYTIPWTRSYPLMDYCLISFAQLDPYVHPGTACVPPGTAMFIQAVNQTACIFSTKSSWHQNHSVLLASTSSSQVHLQVQLRVMLCKEVFFCTHSELRHSKVKLYFSEYMVVQFKIKIMFVP